MPDKPLETTWLGTRVKPAVRRGRRGARRLLRTARSRIRPRIAALGPNPLALGSLVVAAPQDVAGGAARLDALVVTTESCGQGESIAADALEVLIEAERASVPIVLVVTATHQLGHPLAAVASHLVTLNPECAAEIREFAGAERTALIGSDESAAAQLRNVLDLTQARLGSR
ncbi:hypothetical protein [Nesterenkonia sp.]|uniref:hypothetical protein n=1 Tax=Nesterenkonia sp. TaxID=704201 RepID=UPI00261DD156|nr:hypothetical protein [Nesterenkonia sp.]